MLLKMPLGGHCTDGEYTMRQAKQMAVQKELRGLEADVKAQQEQLKQLQADLDSLAAMSLSLQQAEQVQRRDVYLFLSDLQLNSLASIIHSRQHLYCRHVSS